MNLDTGSRNVYLGVDPGKNGCIAALSPTGSVLWLAKINEVGDDDRNLFLTLSGRLKGYFPAAALERVHAMPKQGVSSSFKFGVEYGRLRMLLAALGARVELVTPHRWQRDMGALSRGDKRVTKAAASRMFPGVKVTHIIADALLIAEWARACGRWRVQGG